MRRDWWRLVVLVGIVGGVGEALLAMRIRSAAGVFVERRRGCAAVAA